MNLSNKKQLGKADSPPFDPQQLKPFQKFLHMTRLTKDLKTLLLKLQSQQPVDICLIEDNEPLPTGNNSFKQTVLLPVLLSSLVSYRKITVNFVNKKSRNDSSRKVGKQQDVDFNGLEEQYRSEFFNDEKNKELLEFLWSKKIVDQPLKRNSQQEQEQQFFQFDFTSIEFTIQQMTSQRASAVLSFLSKLFCVFQRFFESSTIGLNKLSLKINQKTMQVIEKNYTQKLCNLSKFYWGFVLSAKNIETIELKVPLVGTFIQAINYRHKVIDSSDKNQQKLLQNVYRIQIIQSRKDDDTMQVCSKFMDPLLKITPNLKTLVFKFNPQKQNTENMKLGIMRKSFQLSKSISESNVLIQNLHLCGVKLSYDEETQQKFEQPDKQIRQKQEDQSYSDNQNLYWLQIMQQNCPYLSGILFQFQEKTQNEERRLTQIQRQVYNKTIMKTRSIINMFHKRGMNNQTFFNTIKILQKQNFDYSTILGVLDKIVPFAPVL